MMPIFLPDAAPDDVLGQTLVGIDQAYESSKGGVDFAWNFYRLKSGLILTLEFCNDDEDNCSLLDRAGVLEPDDVQAVLGDQIESAWSVPDDFDFASYALRMKSGWVISELTHALHGTGTPGVLLFEPGEELPWELTRLWPS